MNSSISVIGGSDGPTSIFLAGKIGINWLNIFGDSDKKSNMLRFNRDR